MLHMLDSSWPVRIFAIIETMKLLFNTRLYSALQKLSSLSIVVIFELLFQVPAKISCDFPQFIPRFDKSSLKRGTLLVRRHEWTIMKLAKSSSGPNMAHCRFKRARTEFLSIKYVCQSDIFGNQMLSMWKLLSTLHSDVDQILGVPMLLLSNMYIFTPVYCHHLHCTKCSKIKGDTFHNILAFFFFWQN